MKNSTLLVLLMAAMAFTGCKKDDEDQQKKDILGKWFFKQEVEKEIINGVVTYEETDVDFSTDEYLEFKSDGTVTSSYGGGQQVDRYQINENNRLVITDEDGDTEDYEITKLNSSELVIYIEDIDGPNAKETLEYTLRK